MRGSPFWQAILVVLVFVGAGLPVWRLTQPGSASAKSVLTVSTPPASPERGTLKTAEVMAVFAPPPADFQIKCLDQTILTGHGSSASFSARWSTTVPAEGVDLVVRTSWPAPPAGASPNTATLASSPAAVRVTVNFADGTRAEKSFWADANGTLAEIFTLAGSPVAEAH